MDFTFGIITINELYLNKIIDSIETQNIPNYEIILVGNVNITRNNTKIINFDETIYPNWITKKKNIIVQNAKYENIVFMHDYIALDKNWYNGFLQYGNNFDIIINPIIDINGNRFRDWILSPQFLQGLLFSSYDTIKLNYDFKWIKIGDDVSSLYKNRILELDDINTLFLDYDDIASDLQLYIYFSGSYFIAKKNVMNEYPLNENHLWGHGEDVEWSQRVRNKFTFKLNKFSLVKILKKK